MDVPGARNKFDRAVRRFNESIRPQLREKFLAENRGLESEADRLLEHHARAYLIDELLLSLGWTLGHPLFEDETNVLTEAFLKSAESAKVVNYLDYLGFDRAVTVPLMVFEAKRLGLAPPSVICKLAANALPALTFHDAENALAKAIKLPKWVEGDWRDQLLQLRKYYRSVVKKFGRPPKVMAIGNGEWLVIIRDPAAAFDGNPTADCFRVFEMAADLAPGFVYLSAFDEIHQALAFERLAPAAAVVPPESIPLAIRQATTVELMRGLQVGYTSSQTAVRKGPRPQIEVRPVLFVRLPAGTWVGVGADVDGVPLPHEGSGHAQLSLHLQEVQKASDGLVDRVSKLLAAVLTKIDLVTHFGDGHSFASRPGVVRQNPGYDTGSRDYLVVTGMRSHFLLAEPRVLDCPCHSWHKCDPHTVGRYPAASALAAPNYVGTRAFFPDGRLHHCAAAATQNLKATQVTSAMQTAFGIRSAGEGGPFCELFDFESMLCCQTCAFFEVCARAKAFKLPCMP